MRYITRSYVRIFFSDKIWTPIRLHATGIQPPTGRRSVSLLRSAQLRNKRDGLELGSRAALFSAVLYASVVQTEGGEPDNLTMRCIMANAIWRTRVTKPNAHAQRPQYLTPINDTHKPPARDVSPQKGRQNTPKKTHNDYPLRAPVRHIAHQPCRFGNSTQQPWLVTFARNRTVW